MANYYTDHPEIAFHLNHPLMKRIVDLKERDFGMVGIVVSHNSWFYLLFCL